MDKHSLSAAVRRAKIRVQSGLLREWKQAVATAACVALAVSLLPQGGSASARVTFPLAVSVSGEGGGTVTGVPAGIACGVDCSEIYFYGTTVQLTATADEGSVFAGWGGACASAEGSTCTVIMDMARTVSAVFNPAPESVLHTLTVTTVGSGAVTAEAAIACGTAGSDCAETVADGIVVTLSAVADEGWSFAGWSACTGADDCAVTMDADKSVTATFVKKTYPLTVSVQGNGTVTSSVEGISCGEACNANFGYGTLVTLTPIAGSGSVFAGWGGACSGTGACTVTMNEAKNVTATFNTQTCTSNCGGGSTDTSADLNITKSADDGTPDAGQTIQYTITVSNAGPDAATGVTVTDVLPAGLTFVSAVTSVGTFNEETGVWSVGSLALNAAATLTMTVTVNSGTAGQAIANTATVTATEADPTGSNNTGTASVTVNTPPPGGGGSSGGSWGAGGPPPLPVSVPQGQVLGTTTLISVEVPAEVEARESQVLGAATQLPRTGAPAGMLLAMALAAGAIGLKLRKR